MSVTITRTPRTTTTIAANMTSNPKPVGVTGYGAYTGAAATLGSYADYIFVKINAAATVGGLFATEKYAVTPGQTYTASAEIYTNKPIQISIKWENAAGTIISQSDGTLIDGDQFAVRSFVTGVAPAGAAAATLTYYLAGGATWAVNDELRMRRQRFTGGTATNYFDGSTLPVGTKTYVWWATPNASPSSELIPDPANVVAPLLMLGSSVERASANRVHRVIGATYPIVTRGPLQARSGVLSLLLADAVEKEKLVALLSAGEQFTLDAPGQPSVNMRFSLDEGAMRVQLDPETRRRWTIDIPFVEVAS